MSSINHNNRRITGPLVQRAAATERQRLAQLEAERAGTRRGRPDDAGVIARDTFLRDGQVAGKSREELDTLYNRFDTDGQAGLSDAEFDKLYTAAFSEQLEGTRVEAEAFNADASPGGQVYSGSVLRDGRDVNREALLQDEGFLRAGGVAEDQLEATKAYFAAEIETVHAQANALIEANKPMEDAVLAQLTTKQRERYGAVAAAVADDPRARLDLQSMLVSGRLTTGPAAHGGGGLLKQLHASATQPLAAGIDRGAFVSDLVQEVADPTSISQQARGTCTMASTQIALALESPAEYVRLVNGLASPAGKVRLANGDAVQRLAGGEHTDDSHRTASSRLFQDALMQYGTKEDYRNTIDADGMWDTGVQKVMDAISGTEGERYRVLQDWRRLGPRGGLLGYLTADKEVGRDEAIRKIEQGLATGRPVSIALNYQQTDERNGISHDSHQVLVTGIKDGLVTYQNPWGRTEMMTVDALKTRITSVHVGGVAPKGR